MAFQELIKGTPDWHEKYNSDFQDVHAQLANKANGQWTFYSQPSELGLEYGKETIEDMVRNMPNYSIYCGSANDPELNTYPSQYGELTIVKLWNHRCSLEFRNDTKNLMWIGTYHELNEPYFKGWKQVATTESPQVYKLMLQTDVSAIRPCNYFKTIDNIVFFTLSLQKLEEFTSGLIVATLPAGFRPIEQMEFPMSGYTKGMSGVSGNIQVNTNGAIIMWFPTPISRAVACGFFVAP